MKPLKKKNRKSVYWKQNERNTISVADANMRTTSSVEAMNSAIQRPFPIKSIIKKKKQKNLVSNNEYGKNESFRIFGKNVRKRKFAVEYIIPID